MVDPERPGGGDREVVVRVREHRDRLGAAILVLIVLGALAVRVPAVWAGLPYTTYIDEFGPLDGAATQIAGGTWDPGRFEYPTLIMTLTALSGLALGAVTGADVGAGAQLTVDSRYIYVIEPPELVLGGRLVVLALNVGMVAVIGLLGRELRGWRVGLVAAAVAGVLPAFVARSGIVITDTPAAAFTACTLYASARLARGAPLTRWSIAAGVSAGLAFGSKYTGGAALIIPLVVLAWPSTEPLARRVRAAGTTVAAAAVTAVVAVPALVLRPSAVPDGISFARRVYAGFPPTDPLFEQALGSDELGPPVLVLAAVGLVALAVRRATRPITVAYLASAVAALVVLLGSDYQPIRNAVPMIPFLCVAAAVALDEAVGLVARVVAIPWPGRAAAVLAAGAVLSTALVVGWTAEHVADQRHVVDSRVDARRWLEVEVEGTDRVLVAEELGFLPRELALVDGDVTVASQRTVVATDDYDYVVMGRLWDDPSPWEPTAEVREPVASFGRLYASCPSGVRREPGGWRCPQTAVPRAWHWNMIEVRVLGPVD